jgi:hypothetical protein
VGSQQQAPAAIPPENSSGTNCTLCWVGRSGRAQISRPSAGFEPRTAQPVTSRYNEYVNPPMVEVISVISPIQIASKRCHHGPLPPKKRLNITLSKIGRAHV